MADGDPCPKCDRRCWLLHGFAGRDREDQPDAQLGDLVPNIRQTSIAFFNNQERLSYTSQIVRLRKSIRHLEVEVNGRRYTVGYTSGIDHNCLIDTLQQKLEITAN